MKGRGQVVRGKVKEKSEGGKGEKGKREEEAYPKRTVSEGGVRAGVKIKRVLGKGKDRKTERGSEQKKKGFKKI